MYYVKVSLTTKTEAVDFISASFYEIGINGIEIEDNVPLTEKETKGMFIDILPELEEDKGIAKLNFYLEEDDNIEEVLTKVNLCLDEISTYVDLGERKLEVTKTDDKDWLNNWKEFFKPFLIEDILIKPTWEKIPKDTKYETLIEIDPGTAFGTGTHETTKLCILKLREYIKRQEADFKLLDIGTGSGILSILALKLGASFVCATELDENALATIYENLEKNNISKDTFKLINGNIIDDISVKDEIGYDKYELCVINILADVIIKIQKDLSKHLKKGAILICSGIIDTKEELVKEAFNENKDFKILEVNSLGEWRSITLERV